MICVALLAGYWALMTFVPVPGIGAPSLAEPGRNLAHYLDELYLPGREVRGHPAQHDGGSRQLPAGRVRRVAAQERARCPASGRFIGCLAAASSSLVIGFVWARAVSHRQAALDLDLCAGGLRLQRDPARNLLPGHRTVAVAALGAAVRLDRDERHHHLPGRQRGELPPARVCGSWAATSSCCSGIASDAGDFAGKPGTRALAGALPLPAKDISAAVADRSLPVR